METIACNAVITRSMDVMASEMDEELVMMNMENNAYYGLNKVGREIWELLEKEQTVASLCETLTRQYDVTPEQCREEVSALIGKLRGNGLVTVA